MPFAARVSDQTGHPGIIVGPGVPTVFIGGLPVSVTGDQHVCLLLTPAGAPAHPPTPFLKGSLTVLIGGRPALRVGDMAGCGAPIITGAPNVIIGG